MTEQQPNLPGARLRTERKRQNLSEQDVSARLHLSMTYLKALESDDYERLPQAAFVKGYVRNYARLLGLPAEDLVRDFQTLVQDRGDDKLVSPVHMVIRERGPGWLWPAVVIAVAVVIGLGWWGTRGMGLPDDLPGLSAPQATLPSLPGSADEEDAASPASLPQEPVNVEAPSEALPEESDTGAPGVSAPDAPTVGAPPAGPTELAMNEPAPLDVLQVSFGGNCWVQVTDAAGEEIYQGQQRSGSQLALEGEAPFRVTLGNAAAVTVLQFNGETQSLPTAAPGRVIRITVP
ncbi:hypothetical protein A167_02525 [Alcanivorax sp. S71-1-4]|uniref:RodZ domain-containing protein n=1 Tax=Alcanivorax sp. S71-1-4 TaxID=1177159 RepID=UPI001358F288|nr:RodZ domain-containing protein [Alcanivorax sp. S71-1-4]KAF0808677.1 hypothetical protein A167_02525 [Alcanivorax sp. S71-1-4]